MKPEIKIVLTDIDGVWTDGRIYLDEEGKSFKAFSTQDSVGVSLLRLMDIPLIVITGEDSQIIKHRASKLQISSIYTGVRNKLFVAEKAVKKLGFTLTDAAYIGDDIIDLPLLMAVGLGAVPANAPDYLKKHVKTILKKESGNGVFREFCEMVAEHRGQLDEMINKYLDRATSAKY